MHQLVIAPDTGLHDLLGCVWNEVDFHFLVEFRFWNFDGMVEQRDSSIAIDDSGLAQAKDVLGRGVGLGQRERAEQAIAIFPCFCEADAGNLFGSGVDLVVVVAVDLFLEDRANIFHG